MRNLLLALFLTGFSSLIAQQTTPATTEEKTAIIDTAKLRVMKDSINGRFKQFFDVDMLIKCVQVRQISNVKGFSLLKKNQPLADTISLFERGYGANIFVNSYVNSDQLWPKLLRNKDKITNTVADTKNMPAVGFDILFTPQGNIKDRVFKVYIFNKSSEGLLDSSKQSILQQVTQKGLSKPFDQISLYAKDSVNNAMFLGIDVLRGMIEQQAIQCNIAHVAFEACTNQKYGFDVLPHNILTSYYEELNIKGSKYEVPWKSVAANKPDCVTAKLVLLNKNAPTHEVKFRSSNASMVVTPNPDDGTYQISFTGGSNKSEETIVAYYTETLLTGKEKETVVGKLKLISYAPETKKLVPVLLNNVNFSCDQAELQKVLNNIYKQAAVNWTVGTPIKREVKSWDKDNDDKLLIETAPFSRYSKEMDAIIDAIKNDPETYYVIITNIPNSLGYAGYMPLKSDFAFFFTSQGSQNEAYQTIAHEVGHGAFYLKHISDEYKINDASDNLMNRYAAGTALWKPQWDWIGDPSWRLYMFQKEDDAASLGSASLVCVTKVPKFYGTTFLNPARQPIDIGNSIPFSFFSEADSEEKLRGTLARFVKDGVLYTTYYNKLTNSFDGYAPKAEYKTRTEFDKAVYKQDQGKVEEAQVLLMNPATGDYDILKNGTSLFGGIRKTVSSCTCDDKTAKDYIDGNRRDLILARLTWHDGVFTNFSKPILYMSPSGQPLEIPSDWRVLVLNESSSEPYLPLTEAIYGFENKADKKVYIADIENAKFNGYLDESGNTYSFNLTGTKHNNPGICNGISAHYHFFYYNSPTKEIVDMYYCKNLATGNPATCSGTLLPAINYCYNDCELKSLCEQDKIDINFTTLFNNNIDYKYNYYGDGGTLSVYNVNGQIFYIYANKDAKDNWYYLKYNQNQATCCEKWQRFNFPYPTLHEQLKLVIEKTGHATLDIIGFEPTLFGLLADGINGTWYMFEGEKGDATLCYASMVPVFSDVVIKGGKYTIKAFKSIKKAAEVASEINMGADASKAFARIGKYLNSQSLTNLQQCLYETGVLLTKHGEKAAEIEKFITSVPKEKLQAVLTKIGALDDVKRAEFLSIIKYTDNLPATHIARNLEKVDEAVIESYESLRTTTLKTDIDWLKRASEWKQYDIVYTQVGDVVQLTGKNGDEIAQVVKEGDELILEISDDFIISSGQGTVINTKVRSVSGDNIINGAIVKTNNGIRFIEDVSSYGTSIVQQTVKQRHKLREALTGIKASEEAHHVIPVQLLKDNDVVRKAVEGGFEFNTAKNGLAIEKYSKASGAGRHASHPEYTKQIEARLNSWELSKNYNYSAKDAKEFLEVITEDIKFIIENPLNSKVKINALKLEL